MPEILTNAKRVVILYKMAVARFCLFVLGTVCGSIQTALAGAAWDAINRQQKFLMVVGIVATVCSTIGAFFDKTLARLSTGELPAAGTSAAPFVKPPTSIP